MHRYEDEVKEKDNRSRNFEEMNREYKEEMGADFAAGTYVDRGDRAEFQESETKSMGYSLGWVALVFAIASWFVWPVLLGVTSAVLGFIAYRQGARKTGAWSMGVGLVAAAVYLFIIPLYYAVS
ncbi:DUF4190 domain-containing protein [Paenibacillus thailandensis]|uniref:DUF4190 domain-containing protein n=1 Tax=Paenibacillus thailandensis TaxID=393250 RepID=A0ABW5QZL9_9BACL